MSHLRPKLQQETTSGTTAEPVKSSSPAPPPQPVPLKVEPGAGDAVGLSDITQQLNQSQLAVLLNLLQSQTDLSIPQMAQLRNIHSNPGMQQHLEALNQSINALTEASSQKQDSESVAPEESLKDPLYQWSCLQQNHQLLKLQIHQLTCRICWPLCRVSR